MTDKIRLTKIVMDGRTVNYIISTNGLSVVFDKMIISLEKNKFVLYHNDISLGSVAYLRTPLDKIEVKTLYI